MIINDSLERDLPKQIDPDQMGQNATSDLDLALYALNTGLKRNDNN